MATISIHNSEITLKAREALKGKWAIAVGTSVLLIAATTIIQALPIIGFLISLVIAGALNIGYSQFVLALVNGEKAETEMLFGKFDILFTGFVAYFLMALFVILWTMLLIIPGIIAAFAYSMTWYILAENPEMSANDAIAKSKEMMAGNKMKLFFLMLRFIGWGILCIFTLGIGFIFLFPYAAVSCGTFYNELKSNQSSVTV